MKAAADHFTQEIRKAGALDCISVEAGEQTVLLGNTLGLTEDSMVFEGSVRGMQGVLKVGLPFTLIQSLEGMHIPSHDQVIFWPIYESSLCYATHFMLISDFLPPIEFAILCSALR